MTPRLSNRASTRTLRLIARASAGKPGTQLTVGLLNGDEVAIRVFGSVGETEPRDHVYEIGSITKTFTASLVAKYASEGRMSFRDRLSAHLDWLDPRTPSPPLTRVLSHTAGYPALAPITRSQYVALISGMILGRGQDINPFDVTSARFRGLANGARVDDHDYAWRYSNFGFALVGSALQTVAGMSYTRAMNDFIRCDLGLMNTRVGTSPELNLRGVTGRGADSGNWSWEGDRCELMQPAGAISSTARDLLGYARLYTQRQHDYPAALQHPRATISRRDDMALGWWLRKGDHNVIHHGGGTGSFSSFLMVDLGTRTASVALVNRRVNGSLDRRIAESLLDDMAG